VADIKPAYLVHGDDETKLDDWRARVRKRVAEDETAELDVLRGERLDPAAAADTIGLLTLAVGRRWIVADGVQDWKEKDVAPVAQALKHKDPDTVVVFLTTVNRKARGKAPAAKGLAPAALVKAVEKVGGEVRLCEAPGVRGLPKWVMERARELELGMDREAAERLVELAGIDENGRPWQRRLQRELEKLALLAGDGGTIDRDMVEALTGTDVHPRVHDIADAVIDGDRERAVLLAEQLRAEGEPVTYVIFGLLRKTLDVRRAWGALESGLSQKDLAAALELRQPWMVKRLAAQASQADSDRLERTVQELAELDWAVRGGGKVDEETALTLAVARAAA
jgi:DNA polymerase-3 subunit delta